MKRKQLGLYAIALAILVVGLAFAGVPLQTMLFGLLVLCIGPVFGRVSGVLIAFLVPFLDIGIAQSPMLRTEPPDWARFLPGYGADRVLLDGGLTTSFDETGALLLGLGRLLGLGVPATWLFRKATA